MSPSDASVLGTTLALAGVTTVLLLLLAIPLAWWLTFTASRWRAAVLALCTLPLVLPPTVLGFYLLITMGPNGMLGRITHALALPPLAFSFSGLVLGSVIFSLPFALLPLQQSFALVGRPALEMAATLRARPSVAFLTVVLPMTRASIGAAAILSFAHTIGEFGVVLMIGGNIPEQTQVLSTHLYSYVEMMDYTSAHNIAGGLVLFSFVVLLVLIRLNVPAATLGVRKP